MRYMYMYMLVSKQYCCRPKYSELRLHKESFSEGQEGSGCKGGRKRKGVHVHVHIFTVWLYMVTVASTCTCRCTCIC